jgi:hypothetical protein
VLSPVEYAGNDPKDGVDPTGTCTGSRIDNKDGTCAGSGGSTTDTNGDAQGTFKRRQQQKNDAAIATLVATRNAMTADEAAGAATR